MQDESLNTFVLVSTQNGCGLQTDYELLKELLEAAGKTVHIAFTNSPAFKNVDVVIFLEIIDARWFGFSKQLWAMPNSEWWRQEWDQFIPRFTKVLCKTKDCYDLWEKRAQGRCVYLGFESRDFYQPEIPRKREFLHLAGGSINKGSGAVLNAWAQYKIPYPLTVIGSNLGRGSTLHQPNVTVVSWLADIRHQLNAYLFHILPSRYEGWGHVLHEGLGCGSVMLTTDAAPMNEATGLYKPLLVPASAIGHLRVPGIPGAGQSISNMYDVSTASVHSCVLAAMALTNDQIAIISKEARDGFLKDRESFRLSLSELLKANIDVSKLPVMPSVPIQPPQPSQSLRQVQRVYTNNGLTIDWWSRHPRPKS
jgi:hypothetical protein